ncbi:MAG: hypothetical protein ABR921_09675 [Candidatus Sulfotelmatobacter sp.]|jgi:hypothetical protein
MKFSNPYSKYVQPQVYDAWETGFCVGFCGPTGISTPLPVPNLIVLADCEAEFNQGVVAGQSAAAFGWDVVDPPCMEAREGEDPGAAELAVTGGREVGGIAADTLVAGGLKEGLRISARVGWTIVKTGAKVVLWTGALKTFSVAVTGAMIELVFTGYGLVWTKPAEQTELPALGQTVVNVLNSRGIFSCAIYMGAAADPSAVGRELCVTPLFRTKWDASNAAKRIGRRQWAVVEWRTDRSGGFGIVDGPGW